LLLGLIEAAAFEEPLNKDKKEKKVDSAQRTVDQDVSVGLVLELNDHGILLRGSHNRSVSRRGTIVTQACLDLMSRGQSG